MRSVFSVSAFDEVNDRFPLEDVATANTEVVFTLYKDCLPHHRPDRLFGPRGEFGQLLHGHVGLWPAMVEGEQRDIPSAQVSNRGPISGELVAGRGRAEVILQASSLLAAGIASAARSCLRHVTHLLARHLEWFLVGSAILCVGLGVLIVPLLLRHPP